MYGEKSAAKYFKVDFSLHCAAFHSLSLSLAREELSLTGGIFGAPPVPVSRLFVRGESGGEEEEEEENLEKGFYCWRRIIGFYQWVRREPRSGSLLRGSSVLFASHLAAHFQFDAARAFRGLLYSSTIYPELIVFARIPEENSWDYLGSRITAGKWPPFEIRSSIRPVPFHPFLFLLLFLKTTLEHNTETFLEFLLAACIATAIPVNKFEDGCSRSKSIDL